ncbi:MAG: GrxA family glutaredoxin [Enterobacterales bacterium endosymbiont of Blomia tropicalis]|uniref:GrxA family glutaredoxin n=1 Tax=Mixta mediterraneensis TaxID=2758443 RepID=UPI0018766191|nr:GrxA family glutaredoxin [Mixta mediterraneensis]MBE5250822.1 GrxA family glutaredoxin [Mixta mediterraneensis]MDL4913343.1 GrxA family glutaredoxin [Mixta mediterraneensis]
MIAVIFGRPGCSYCVRAKELADKLAADRDDFSYQYVDIQAEGITKADLEASAGKPVSTVPQIFLDEQHIGGYTEFAAWSKENLGFSA